MSKKRFTDTEVWEKDWFYELTPVEKLAWFYIKDKCSNIGIWTPSKTVAPFFLGSDIDWEAFAEKCNGNIKVLESGKWWLVDFCKFQHPDLKPESEGNANKAVQSYIRELREHGLWDLFIARATGVGRASNAPKEQERVKEEVKEKEQEKKEPRKKPPPDYRSPEAIAYWANYSSKHSSIGGNDYPPWFDKMWTVYPARNGKKAGKYLAFKAVFQIADSFGELRLIYNAICDYAESCGDYAKDMHRFLANDFWRDFLFAESWPEHLTAYKAKYSLDEAKQLYSEGTKP